MNRKGPLPTGFFFGWILLGLLLIVSRVDFIAFVLFLEAVGVREYCCMTVESRSEALYFARSRRVTRVSCATSPRPSGLVALDLGPKPPELRCSWRCTQPRVAKATTSVAVVGKKSSIPRAAAIWHRMIHAAGGRG